MGIYEQQLEATLSEANDLCDLYAGVIGGSDRPSTLAFCLDQIRATKRTLSDLERECEAAIANASDEKMFDVDSLGRVEIHRRLKRSKWDHEGVAAAVARTITKDPNLAIGDGSIRVRDIIEQYRECVSTGAAKVAFEDFTGHERDEFCEVEDGGVSVRIAKPDNTARIEDYQ